MFGVHALVCVSVIQCVVLPFILDVSLLDAPVGVTQLEEEGHTGFLHFSSAVLTLTFLARRIQSSRFLVDREVDYCGRSFSTSCLGTM